MFGKNFLSYLFPTGNKKLTEIWHGLIQHWFKPVLTVTQRLHFLDPTFRHYCLVPLIGGENLYPHFIGDWNTTILRQRYLAMQTLMFASRLTFATHCNFSQIRYVKVYKVTKWTIGHDLMLLCFKDLMNVTEKLQFKNQRFDTPF